MLKVFYSFFSYSSSMTHMHYYDEKKLFNVKEKKTIHLLQHYFFCILTYDEAFCKGFSCSVKLPTYHNLVYLPSPSCNIPPENRSSFFAFLLLVKKENILAEKYTTAYNQIYMES